MQNPFKTVEKLSKITNQDVAIPDKSVLLMNKLRTTKS